MSRQHQSRAHSAARRQLPDCPLPSRPVLLGEKSTAAYQQPIERYGGGAKSPAVWAGCNKVLSSRPLLMSYTSEPLRSTLDFLRDRLPAGGRWVFFNCGKAFISRAVQSTGIEAIEPWEIHMESRVDGIVIGDRPIGPHRLAELMGKVMRIASPEFQVIAHEGNYFRIPYLQHCERLVDGYFLCRSPGWKAGFPPPPAAAGYFTGLGLRSDGERKAKGKGEKKDKGLAAGGRGKRKMVQDQAAPIRLPSGQAGGAAAA